MIVDRRKDTYDELMLLSRDVSVSRKRRQRVTNWVIGGAVAVSGIFIAATSAHMSNLNDAKHAAEQQRDNLRSEFAKVSAERDYYKAGNDWLREFAQTMSDDGEIDRVIQNFPQPASEDAPDVAQLSLANIVWIVDGSRRYPIKTNDILWIPEARMWITVDSEFNVSKLVGPRPAPGEEGDRIDVMPHFIVFPRNASRCIRLDLHRDSIRPGFAGEYVDIEVLYFTPSSDQPCSN